MANDRTPQDRFFDEQQKHMLRMERVKAGQVKEAKIFIEQLAQDLLIQVERSKVLDAKRKETTDKRIDELFKDSQKMVAASYSQLFRFMSDENFDVMEMQNIFDAENLNGAFGVDLFSPAMSIDQMRTLVRTREINSVPAKEYWTRQGQTAYNRFKDTMRVGVAQGESLDKIRKRIKEKGGWEEKTNQQLDALIRTETQNILNVAMNETYKKNADVIDALEHVSVFDNRTTLGCIARDGLRWSFPELKPLDHSVDYIQPPLHYQCRSLMMAVLVPYSKIFGTDGVFSEKEYRNSLETISKPRSTETAESYRKRIDRLVENEKQRMSKPPQGDQRPVMKWLKDNPDDARKILGKTRSELLLDGKMDLKQMLSSTKGIPLSVKELTKQYGYPDKEQKKSIQASPAGKVVQEELFR